MHKSIIEYVKAIHLVQESEKCTDFSLLLKAGII